jgi:hypothetical protein
MCKSASGRGKFIITGNTPSISIQSNEMLVRINQMDDLATEFKCEFDGWDALLENKNLADKK